MCAASKGESIHNTQIDFLTRGSQPLTATDVRNMISSKTFSDKLAATSVKRQQAVATYQVYCQNKNQLDKAILKAIFSNKKVKERVVIRIEDIAESLTSYTKLDRSVKQGKQKTKNKAQKEKRAALMKMIEQAVDQNQSDIFTKYTDLAQTLSGALKTWLATAKGPTS
jgi:hypothetical protein